MIGTQPRGFGIFMREKPIELLLCLNRGRENYPSMLAKDSKCTYSHTVHLLQKMERLGLVNFQKKGRLKLVNLTKKGETFTDALDSLVKSLR
jgi:DNA-binding MarR family transcriptional regulator